MQVFSARIVLSLLLLTLPLRPALASDVDFPSPDTAVNQYGITTYLDLARHFVPDIKPTDSGYVGSKRIPLRHIAGKDFEDADAATFGFYDISTIIMHADGKERLLVLFDFAQAAQTAQGVAVLALYDATREIKLLDAVDVGFDQSTYFFDQALMPVSPTSDVILTMSTHFNSSQAYTTQSMIMVRGDRLQLIDTASLFSDKLCAVERQQNIRYAANPDAGKPSTADPYAPITVFVTETATPIGAACGDDAAPPTGTREIRVSYKWDMTTGRYVRDSDALEKLAKANEQRF
jgi:hypothetical protein